MSIITRSLLSVNVKSARKSTPRPFTCSIVALTVEINDARYAVDQTAPGEFGSKSFRLTKHGRTEGVYDVIRTHDGFVECDCPDYEARHKGNGFGMCKHGRALTELGLMLAPSPELAPIAPANRVRDEFDEPADNFDNIVIEVAPEPEPSPRNDFPGSHLLGPVVASAPVEPPTPSEPTPTVPAIPAVPVAPVAPEPVLAALVAIPAETEDEESLDVASDPETWPAWVDEGFWTTGPDLEPLDEPSAEDMAASWQSPFEPSAEDLAELAAMSQEWAATDHLNLAGLTLAELVDRQGAFYRTWGNAAGDLFASAMEELADKVRATSATTPAEYEARIEILDGDIRAPRRGPRFPGDETWGC